jgi:hypothetical protein
VGSIPGIEQETMAQAKTGVLEKYRAAKQELIDKYLSLKDELVAIEKELKALGINTKTLRPGKQPKSANPTELDPATEKKVSRLKKSLERARYNLTNTKDSYASKKFSDRVVELEDEIRLLTTED